ncbi:hypothetical protein GCM10022268_25240 [Sphingomonas cynarae]|uniref:Uncharacterized protein n=1 Tax=Sphingomonas cynarae TaxID=930197 RepID=A0ABP7E807_9SPHN
MPLQGHRQFGRGHAATIIRHLDAAETPFRQRHRDAACPRIEGVLDQFLQRAGGPFHHLTGGDAIDEMLGEAAY